MDVEPITGEAFRCYVQSSSRQNVKFLVDLEEHDFNGACSCENFSLTRIREIHEGKRSQCKHIRVAWDWWAITMARKIKAAMDAQ